MNKYIKIISLLLIVAILFTPSTIFAFNKKEEIYVNLDSKGTPIKNIVNNTLTDIGIKNETDYSNLKNIKNLTGDEKLNIDGNKISFKGNNSLTYSGTSLKKLPIKVSIDYYLNNKKIDLNNLKNKKGKVTIDISFENLMYDKNTNLHTPFVVTTSILLNGVNKNIKVTNGKNINIANKNIILGISAPGLYEDLDNEALKDLDTVSISYDTDSFEENDIYFISSPKLLNKTDIEGIKNLDNVKSSFNKLSNGMNTLEDGSKKLSKGTNDLNKGTKSLSKGLKKALKGSNALKDKIVGFFKNVFRMKDSENEDTIEKHLKLIPYNQGQFEEQSILILVSGYFSSKSDHFEEWENLISVYEQRYPNALIYFYNWPSSAVSLKKLVFNVKDFRDARQRAKICGKILALMIMCEEFFNGFKINLSAFSLGNHVIKNTLKELEEFGRLDLINNVVFMAGATDINCNFKWEHRLGAINGSVVNCYSDYDIALWYCKKITKEV